MRIAVVADVHGDGSALERTLTYAASVGYDLLVSVGDLVDYLHPTRPDAGISDVVRWEPALGRLTAEAMLVRGNQEQRALDYLGERHLPPELARVLRAPLEVEIQGAKFAHAHALKGEMVSADRWVPLYASFDKVLIHGHHHRNSVVRLDGPGRSWSSAVDIPLRSGEALSLDGAKRHIINVGPAQGDSPSWGLFDSRRRTYTPFFTVARFRKTAS